MQVIPNEQFSCSCELKSFLQEDWRQVVVYTLKIMLSCIVESYVLQKYTNIRTVYLQLLSVFSSVSLNRFLSIQEIKSPNVSTVVIKFHRMYLQVKPVFRKFQIPGCGCAFLWKLKKNNKWSYFHSYQCFNIYQSSKIDLCDMDILMRRTTMYWFAFLWNNACPYKQI